MDGDFGVEMLNVYDFALGVVHMAPLRGFRFFFQLRTVAGRFVADEPEAVFRRFDFSCPELGMWGAEERTRITDLNNAGTAVELHEYGMSCSEKRDDEIIFRLVDSGDVAVRKEFGLILRGSFGFKCALSFIHFGEKHEK